MKREDIIKAGKIAKEVKIFAKRLIKKDMALLDIAEKIENKIIELGGKPAFPTNLSINEIAAHYTPADNDKTKAHGLLKIDFGVHISGWTSDTAFSLDLENLEENKKLIQVSEEALKNAEKEIHKKITTGEIGKIIQETIESKGYSPIVNLSGHQMEKYELHAGLTIPNINNKSTEELGEGIFAIEPFATKGNGKVKDGKESEIYILINTKNVRSSIAREILEFISEEYQTLPFCTRWLTKIFGAKALIGLKQLKENGNLHNFPQLIEISGAKVSQAENTILLYQKEKIITTE